jgi:hypothetical protein
LAKDEHRDGSDIDDPSESTHAADEPTAVWDFEALRKAGLSEIAQLPEAEESGPATPADGMASKRASIIVEGDKGPEVIGAAPAPETPLPPVAPQLARPAPQLAGNEGMSWVSLMGLSLLFGAIAYFAIRFLR